MYKNSGSSSLLVSTKRKRAYWSSGTYPANYKIYTVDMLIDALEFVLYNAYVQFGGYLFKQILGIPMGVNASRFTFHCRSLSGLE